MKAITALAFLVLGSFATAADPVKSGPQPGERVPGPFEPFNITGANAGEDCCLFCKFGSDPVIMIFAREPSDALTALIKKIDDLAAKHKKQDVGSCAIFFENGTGLRPLLKEQAKKHDLKEIILGTLDGAPKGYKLAKDADVTVLLYTEAVVKANFAFRKNELNHDGIKAITASVRSILKD